MYRDLNLSGDDDDDDDNDDDDESKREFRHRQLTAE